VSGPTVGVTLFGMERLFGGDLRALVDVAVWAERAGIGQVVLPDHVAIGPRTDRYPFGTFPVPEDQPWPEPLTLLAAIASRTEQIRLATGVLVAPLRPAALLAKTVATLDVLSGGRVDLGVGTGWQAEEYEACGVPFAGRGARMDDALRAVAALWAGAPTTFASPTTSLREIWSLPAPVQPGGVPIWFGGPGTAKTAARIAELGQGWLPIGGTAADAVGAGIAVIHDALARAGRDPAELGVRVTASAVPGHAGTADLEQTIAAVMPFLDAGATAVSFPLVQFLRARDDVEPVLARLAHALPR
jgi:probable F420-dependent oxidoreductase